MISARVLVIFLLGTLSSFCQYNFSGQIPVGLKNKTVYLSTIENYRKTSRVYTDQILMQTQADTSGYFNFIGDNLSEQNRMYRIHTDDCNEKNSDGTHFFRDCSYSTSILFIAKKGDTITFPLLENNQSFCAIISTNPASAFLLEIDSLKEEMILDFMISDSKANTGLNFKKWFQRLQAYGIQTREPLAELYIYNFLSDRKNETYNYYLKELQSNEYYSGLKTRLTSKYSKSPFSLQYAQELNSDESISSQETFKNESSYTYILFGGGIILLLITGYIGLAQKKKQVRRKAISTLTSQEVNILNAIRENKTNKEIASHLFISLSTVKTHINNIYKKLDVITREELKKKF